MNRLTTEKRAQILGCLCEGMGIRATARITDVAINSVVKLLLDTGNACWDYQDKPLRNLPFPRGKRIALDGVALPRSRRGIRQVTQPPAPVLGCREPNQRSFYGFANHGR